MNIVFEGITGTGKTTLINQLYEKMKKNNLEVTKISEIDSISPLSSALGKMCEKDTFLRMKEPFSTVITESLILSADYQYMKEYTDKIKGYKLFDRDIFTEIVYQKYFIEREYGKDNDFFDNWKNCLLFKPKKIDLIIYVEAPIKICIKRNEERDNHKLLDDDKRILKDLSVLQKEYVISYCNNENVDLIFLDGTKNIDENIELIYSYIKNSKFII